MNDDDDDDELFPSERVALFRSGKATNDCCAAEAIEPRTDVRCRAAVELEELRVLDVMEGPQFSPPEGDEEWMAERYDTALLAIVDVVTDDVVHAAFVVATDVADAAAVALETAVSRESDRSELSELALDHGAVVAKLARACADMGVALPRDPVPLAVRVPASGLVAVASRFFELLSVDRIRSLEAFNRLFWTYLERGRNDDELSAGLEWLAMGQGLRQRRVCRQGVVTLAGSTASSGQAARLPLPRDIAVTPVLAMVYALDFTLEMSRRVVCAAHPVLDDDERRPRWDLPPDRSDEVARCLVLSIGALRDALSCYRQLREEQHADEVADGSYPF